MTSPIRPLKKLGQHFLNNSLIAGNIANSVNPVKLNYNTLIEIGPGTGVLTQHLLELNIPNFYAIEIDTRAVDFLKQQYPLFSDNIIEGDFLESDLAFSKNKQFGIIGNFPYNISSQILFKVYENRELIPEVVGMFQDEVAKRICSEPGNKNYGILSVLLQTFYTTEYLFQVLPENFNPVPKVTSGVIRLQRKTDSDPGCDLKKFKIVIKTAFNQRRKIISNSLKSIIPEGQAKLPYADKRPEQLSYQQFAEITRELFGKKD
jgi:16S rRNA (adenine1518-N6/adenine1519-N6)-dimethyltransferase